MTETEHHAAPNGHVGHELSDLKPTNIALFGIALAGAITLVLAVSYWIFEYNAGQHAKEQVPPSPLAHTREPTPEPLLQVYAAEDLQEMRAAEDAALNGYGWVDKEAGIARIPVEKAIEVLANKGLPVRKEKGKQQAEGSKQKTETQERRSNDAAK
jgi:hypothetical protein